MDSGPWSVVGAQQSADSRRRSAVAGWWSAVSGFSQSRRMAVVLAICLLAFGLRAFRLGAQSLWYDEGLSVHLASLPPRVTMEMSAVTDHPPLHALMLGAWMQMAGRSEFAVRFVSLWWSVLAAALTWRMGRELLTDSMGAIAALLMAASAFAVWYAQETRGYSMLLALTLIMTWAFASTLFPSPSPYQREGRRSSHPAREKRHRTGWAWTAFVASGVAALYTHYYAAFTLLALNLAFLAVLACQAKRTPCSVFRIPFRDTRHATRNTHYELRITLYALRFYLSQLIIIAGFSPWLPAAIRQAATNVTYFPGRVGWQTVVSDALRAFATGDAAPTLVAAWAVGVMGALAAIGAFAEQPRTTRLKRVIAALLVAAPVAAMAAIAWQKPKFAPRYLIEALPAFYLLVGAGFVFIHKGEGSHSPRPVGEGPEERVRPEQLRKSICDSWRPSRTVVRIARFLLVAVGASILAAVSILSLRATYFDPARQRPDVRGAAAYITSNERPGDVVVLLSGHQLPVFNYYDRGKSIVAPMPDSIMPPAQSPLDYGAARQLQNVSDGYSRLWLVLWQRELADPTNVIMNELITKARRLGVGQDFQGMRLLLFDLAGHAPFGDGPQHAADWRFAEPISLAGYDLSTASRAPGESLDLALYWRAAGPIAGNYTVFTHLLAPDGRLVDGADHIAGADNYPTSLWTNGALVRNSFTLRVPSDAPPGEYALEVGLYDAQSARGRLRLTDGLDRILLAPIVVQ